MTGEKNHQVQRMFEIYNQATKVLIWLGEANEDSEFVLSEIEQGSLGRLEEIPNETKLNTILGKPWWKRIWTLQEGFAARPDSLVVCEGRAVEWSKVCDQLPRFAECGVDPRYQNVIDFLAMCQFQGCKECESILAAIVLVLDSKIRQRSTRLCVRALEPLQRKGVQQPRWILGRTSYICVAPWLRQVCELGLSKCYA